CVEAVNFYKAFLRNYPDEKGVEIATTFIDKLEDCRAKQAAQPREPAVPPPDPPQPSTTEATPAPEPTTAIPAPGPTPRPAPERGGGGLRLAGIVTGGLGLVAIGSGIYFGTQAAARQDELERSLAWDQELFDRGARADRNAKVLLVAGGVATIGGAA